MKVFWNQDILLSVMGGGGGGVVECEVVEVRLKLCVYEYLVG